MSLVQQRLTDAPKKKRPSSAFSDMSLVQQALTDAMSAGTRCRVYFQVHRDVTDFSLGATRSS